MAAKFFLIFVWAVLASEETCMDGVADKLLQKNVQTKVNRISMSTGEANLAPSPGSGDGWNSETMKVTHYWDCSGQGCDSGTLQPWDMSKYVSPPGYGPQDPGDFGGAVYGEKIWMTGAASDTLAQLMGPDDGCCGGSNEGGCGKCLLIQIPAAVQASWTAIVMKKNRCPPWSNGCSSGIPHFDMAVPGFDNLQFSTANICGNPGTGFRDKQQSEALGNWYNSCNSTAECAHLCDMLEPEFIKGCKLFASWGWTKGDPSGVKFRAVECPAAYVEYIGGLFDKDGVVGAGSHSPSPGIGSSPTPQPTPSPSKANPAPSPGTVGGCCTWDGSCGGCSGDWCHQSVSNCEEECGGEFNADMTAPACDASPTPRPTPPPTPGCCTWDGSCGGCSGDWCHQSVSNCEEECGGEFNADMTAPACK